jgi:uncharacterized SAM-dependent methyltransferase
VDLRKSTRELGGVQRRAGRHRTLQRNILQVLNRELGADFDLMAFSIAPLREHLHRIEMHLVSARDRGDDPRDRPDPLTRGETIRANQLQVRSSGVQVLFEAAGLELEVAH